MRVFLTGGTGYIGSAVLAALRARGHEVASLSRSPEQDATVRALRGTPVRGDLASLSSLGTSLEAYDALVHLAQDYKLGPAADRNAIETLLGAARRSGAPRSVVYTSGVWVLGETRGPTDEDGSTERPFPAVAWRPQLERDALGAATPELAVAVVRPGIVWGERRGLFQPMLDSAAREAARYVGSGDGRWPPIHREDLADLYRRIAEGRARGIYHGVDGSSPRVADLARAIAEAAGKKGATRSVPLEEARKAYGAMADAIAGVQVVVSRRSAELGWAPRKPRFPEAAALAWAEWKG